MLRTVLARRTPPLLRGLHTVRLGPRLAAPSPRPASFAWSRGLSTAHVAARTSAAFGTSSTSGGTQRLLAGLGLCSAAALSLATTTSSLPALAEPAPAPATTTNDTSREEQRLVRVEAQRKNEAWRWRFVLARCVMLVVGGACLGCSSVMIGAGKLFESLVGGRQGCTHINTRAHTQHTQHTRRHDTTRRIQVWTIVSLYCGAYGLRVGLVVPEAQHWEGARDALRRLRTGELDDKATRRLIEG